MGEDLFQEFQEDLDRLVGLYADKAFPSVFDSARRCDAFDEALDELVGKIASHANWKHILIDKNRWRDLIRCRVREVYKARNRK